MDNRDITERSPHELDQFDAMSNDRVAEHQARAFRRFFVTRMSVVAAAAWLLGWPMPLLPHTVFWTLLATAALVFGLTSTPRSPSATRGTTPTRSR